MSETKFLFVFGLLTGFFAASIVITYVEIQPNKAQGYTSIIVPKSKLFGVTDKQPEPGTTYKAIVMHIVDGDTLDVQPIVPMVRIRLLDCWAPERSNPKGPASTANLNKLLKGDSIVTVHIPSSRRHRLSDTLTFGRVLGYVWKDGKNISAEQVKGGFATKNKRKK